MPRAGLSQPVLVEMALSLIDEGETLTLAAVAERAGVRTPSLYKHVASLGELESLVGERLLEEFSAAILGAIGSARGADAVRAGLHGIRAHALANPARYVSMSIQPLDDPRQAPLARELTTRLADAVTDGAPDRASGIHTLRLMRATADGWVRIELAGGFRESVDVDESWNRAVELVAATIGP